MSTSYSEFLAAMEKTYQDKTGLSPKIATDIHLRFQVLAGELAKLSSGITKARGNIFPQSSGGKELDLHGQLRGLIRKAAAKATGQLTFSRHTPALQSLPIPQGTIVATASDPPLYFSTTQPGLIMAGQLQATIPAIAQEAGQESNVLKEQVKVLVTPPPGVGQVTNLSPFGGGSPQEMDDDFRQRVVSSYHSPSNGTNQGYYKALLEAHPLIRLGKVVPRHKGRGTVQLLYVPYSGTQEGLIQSQLQETLIQEREIGVDTTLTSAELKNTSLTLILQLEQGYEFPHLEPLVKKVVQDYFYSLPIGDAFLANHLGKRLLEVSGVKNYHFTAPVGDVVPQVYQKLTCTHPLITIGVA